MIYNIKKLQIEIEVVGGYRCKLYILPTIIREKKHFSLYCYFCMDNF